MSNDLRNIMEAATCDGQLQLGVGSAGREQRAAFAGLGLEAVMLVSAE